MVGSVYLGVFLGDIIFGSGFLETINDNFDNYPWFTRGGRKLSDTLKTLRLFRINSPLFW